MTHIITIEAQRDNDFAQIKEVAERLGLPFKESHAVGNVNEAHQEAALRKFAGSWQGDETADELEALIYGARNDQSRDIEL